MGCRKTNRGVFYALAAYIWWGGAVYYFKAVTHVPAIEVIVHRTIWTALFLAVFLAVTGNLRSAMCVVRDRRTFAMLTVSALLIATSWYSYVWAVENNRVLETSFAYYLMPLISVVLGTIFLNERLRGWQLVSVLLASVGVVVQGLSYGRFPVLSLVIALSFGFYGLVRKKIKVDGTTGLCIEAVILTPLALVAMLYLRGQGQLVFSNFSIYLWISML